MCNLMQTLNRDKVIIFTQLTTIILTTIPYNVTLLYSYTYCILKSICLWCSYSYAASRKVNLQLHDTIKYHSWDIYKEHLLDG